jgi:hypothetical protein
LIHACEHHDEVLEHWRRHDRRNLAICHVDFHDDLRGLMIDRRRGVAYPIGALAEGRAPLDAGNFLAHAVLEGRVERVRWIHGLPGGRAWDTGIVRYSTDLFGLPHRLRHALRRGPELPLVFEERVLARWSGPLAGEWLSVDWDCFASILDERREIPRRVTAFLDRLGSVIPEESYVVYSPEYSHPGLDAFRALVAELGRRFGQPVEWLAPELERGQARPREVNAALPSDAATRAILFLRRRGIY